MSRNQEKPYVSLVVPVYNEAESIPALLEQCKDSLDRLQCSYEIILVDDGSSDGSWELIDRHSQEISQVLGLRLKRNYGQTAALMAGIDQSQGEIVVTMDGDLQNDPADIPRLVAKIEEGYEIVSGWRRQRHDALIGKRLPSVIANAIARRLTGLMIHDQGCALKAYRGPLLRSVSLYSDFHRFVVPLAQLGGARVVEIETNHRPRLYGRSKYGLGRTLRVIADLTTLLMIMSFCDRLLLWFLLFAIFPFILGSAAIVWTGVRAFADPGATMMVPIGSAMILLQTVFAIIAYGFLAERIRQLAPTTGRRGTRLLATLTAPQSSRRAGILIRNIRATPLGPVPSGQPRKTD
jgi:glycosyltransferase involved in cell wall biosynthesis